MIALFKIAAVYIIWGLVFIKTLVLEKRIRGLIWCNIEKLAAIAAIMLGILAYYQYIGQNDFSINSELEARDAEITNLIFDKPYLANIYVAPNSVSKNPFQHAQNQLVLITEEGGINGIQFMGVRKFSCDYWSGKHSAEFNSLIPAYFFAERHLYLIYDAWQLNLDGNTRNFNLSEYTAYVGEIGNHPLFLAAFFEGVRWNYLSEDFSNYMRNLILIDFQDSEYIKSIFPEFVDDVQWRNIVKIGGETVCADVQ